MLITERAGRLRVIRNGVLDPQPVAGAPASYWTGESGLPGAVHGYMDIALHPQFAQNRLVYLSYTKPLDDKKTTVAVARGRFDGKALTEVKDVLVLDRAGTSRIAFGRDGNLYISTTGTDPKDPKDPQNPNTQGGKVLRVRDDGSIPKDNPFVGKPNHRPEVYTLGHRSALGLAVNPATGEMWLNENGPNGGDEINILKPGANYGWPIVSYGRQYTGPWQSEIPGHAGFEPPLVFWVPSIAASGMAFYTGDKFPKWKGDVFVGALRTGEIPGTGHLERILFNEKMEELRRESLLVELRQRIREVRQGPDGLLYLLTDEKEGAVLKIRACAVSRRQKFAVSINGGRRPTEHLLGHSYRYTGTTHGLHSTPFCCNGCGCVGGRGWLCRRRSGRQRGVGRLGSRWWPWRCRRSGPGDGRTVITKAMPIEITVIGAAEPFSNVGIRSQITGQLERRQLHRRRRCTAGPGAVHARSPSARSRRSGRRRPISIATSRRPPTRAHMPSAMRTSLSAASRRASRWTRRERPWLR